MHKPINSFNLLICRHDLALMYHTNIYVKRRKKWIPVDIYNCKKCGLIKKIAN
jgi:hypothetical protein